MPVFNAENFLRKSIESVIKQNYTNWELIIVDDHSNDRSYTIAKSYEIRDPRIKAFKFNRNYGPAHSRNIGIEKSSGDYLAFLDSDDELKCDFLEKLVSTAVEFNADVVWCQHEEINPGRYSKPISNTIKKNTVFSKKQAVELLFHEEDGVYSMWNKFFKKSLIEDNNIRLNEERFRGEDMEFVITVFKKLNRLVCIENHLYNYVRQNSSSIMASYRKSDLPFMLETIKLFRNLAFEYNVKVRVGYYTKHTLSILKQLYLISKFNSKDAKREIKLVLDSEDYNFALSDTIINSIPQTYRYMAKLIKLNPILAILFAKIK